MSDKEIGVRVTATTSGVQDAMNQASQSVKEGMGTIRESFSKIGESIENAHKEIIGFFATFKAAKELKNLVDDVVKFNVESIKMARQLGITANEAQRLTIALEDSYASSEVYTASALKMTRQLRQNEDSLTALGLKTRDANGDLKDTTTLMMEGIQVLNNYQEGTDRNMAAQVMFGRGAADLGNLLTVTQEKIDNAAKTQEKFNLTLTKEGLAATAAYRAALNESGEAMMGLKKVVSDALMPVLTDLIEGFNDSIPSAIMVLRPVIDGLTTAFWALYNGVKIVWDVIKLFAKDIIILFVGVSDAMGKMASGDFTGAAAAMSATWDTIKDQTAQSMDEMVRDSEKTKQRIHDLWYGDETKTEKKDTDTGSGKEKKFEAFDPQAAIDAMKLKQKLEEEAAANTEKLALLGVERNRQHLDEMLKDGEINNQQYLQATLVELDAEYAAQIEFQRAKAVIYADDVVEKSKALNIISQLEKKHLLDIQKLQSKVRDDEKKRFESMMAPITNAIEKSITGIITGTTTLKKAMQNIFQSIVGEAFSMISKIVVKWIAGEVLKTQATVASAAIRTTTESAAATAGIASSGGAATTSIMNDAWQAMAGAFKAMVGIPIVGPILAVGAAAGAFALVAGLAGNIKSASGGYDIPSGLNPMVQAHAEEMILPAKYANLLRGMAESGGSSGGRGGGDTHNYTIQAVDAKSFGQLLKTQAHVLGPAIRQLARNGGQNGGKS